MDLGLSVTKTRRGKGGTYKAVDELGAEVVVCPDVLDNNRKVKGL